MKSISRQTITFTLLCFLYGCSGSATPNYHGNSSQQEMLKLRFEVLNYKNEADKKYAKYKKVLAEECPDYDFGEPFTPDSLIDFESDCPRAFEEYSAYTENFLYHMEHYEKLKSMGGDTKGLELEDTRESDKIYLSPPPEEPKVPSPDEESVDRV